MAALPLQLLMKGARPKATAVRRAAVRCEVSTYNYAPTELRTCYAAASILIHRIVDIWPLSAFIRGAAGGTFDDFCAVIKPATYFFESSSAILRWYSASWQQKKTKNYGSMISNESRLANPEDAIALLLAKRDTHS